MRMAGRVLVSRADILDFARRPGGRPERRKDRNG